MSLARSSLLGKVCFFIQVSRKHRQQVLRVEYMAVKVIFKDERMLLAGKCSPITNSDKITKLFKGRWVNIPVSHLQILAAGTLSLIYK